MWKQASAVAGKFGHGLCCLGIGKVLSQQGWTDGQIVGAGQQGLGQLFGDGERGGHYPSGQLLPLQQLPQPADNSLEVAAFTVDAVHVGGRARS